MSLSVRPELRYFSWALAAKIKIMQFRLSLQTELSCGLPAAICAKPGCFGLINTLRSRPPMTRREPAERLTAFLRAICYRVPIVPFFLGSLLSGITGKRKKSNSLKCEFVISFRASNEQTTFIDRLSGYPLLPLKSLDFNLQGQVSFHLLQPPVVLVDYCFNGGKEILAAFSCEFNDVLSKKILD